MPDNFDRSKAKQIITGYEKRAHTVYPDFPSKIPTVGIGFNLLRPDARAKLQALGLSYDAVLAGRQSLTDGQIDTLFSQDLDAAIGHAQDKLNGFDGLTTARQFVVVDMIFNLGAAGFDGFKNTIDAINAGDWDDAAKEMKASAWYDQVGDRAIKDIGMMQEGDWAGSGGDRVRQMLAASDFGGSGGEPITPEDRDDVKSSVTADPGINLSLLDDPQKSKDGLIRMLDKIVSDSADGGMDYDLNISSLWRPGHDSGPWGGHNEGLACDINKVGGSYVGDDANTRHFVLDVIQHNPYVKVILTPIPGVWNDPTLRAEAQKRGITLEQDPSPAFHIHLRAR